VGQFTLGCNASLGAYLLPGFLDRFYAAAPAIGLEVWCGGSAGVRDAVLARTVHYGVVVNCDPADDLVITPLFHDVIELYATPHRGHDSRTTRSTGIEAAQRLLARAPLYVCDRPVFRDLLDRVLLAGVRPARVVICGDLDLVKNLALEGGCAAILPGRVARYGHPGRLQPVDARLPRHEDTIHLIYRGDLPRTRAARRLREALVERGRELDLEGDGGKARG